MMFPHGLGPNTKAAEYTKQGTTKVASQETMVFSAFFEHAKYI